jgi:hypothetical protein
MMFDQNLIVGLLVIAVAAFAIYTYFPNIFGLRREGFADIKKAAGAKKQTIPTPAGKLPDILPLDKQSAEVKSAAAVAAPKAAGGTTEGFADYMGGGSDSMGAIPMAAAQKPQGCYPREQLNPMDLLPNDANSQWAQVNPSGAGDIQGKNFLSAGALIGVNTVGQSNRNPSYDLRAAPANPQIQGVSPWMNSTIEPDLQRRPLE